MLKLLESGVKEDEVEDLITYVDDSLPTSFSGFWLGTYSISLFVGLGMTSILLFEAINIKELDSN